MAPLGVAGHGLLGAGGVTGGGAPPAAPTIVDSQNNSASWVSTNSTTHNFSTTGLSWSSGQRIIAFTALAGSFTITSLAGNTDDTASLLADVTANVSTFYVHEINVVGGALDATITKVQNSAGRACMILLTISSDLSVITTPAEGNGTANVSLPSSGSFAVTGTKNRLLIAAANVRGGHVTNPITAPSGYTMLGVAPQISDSANSPASTATMTLGVATKAAPSSSGTIPAASWGGLADAVTNSQSWTTLHLALEPAT